MMAKAFVSFLGTSNYVPCTYYINNQEIQNVRFVQEANIRLHCMDWTPQDRILIFTTKEAFRKNWQDKGHLEGESESGDPIKGLGSCITSLGLKAIVQHMAIPDGKSEKEIWDIFSVVYDLIGEGDEIIFDITHALRSIPMLAIVILNYAKVMKNVHLLGIYYGAFEILGPPQEVKKMPADKRRAPIFNLTLFDQLMDWSIAIDRFIKTGDGGLISDLANSSARLKLSQTKGEDRSQHNLRRLAENLDRFTKSLATCRGLDISPISLRLKGDIEDCEKMDLAKPFKPIFERLNNQMKAFCGDVISDGVQAAKWCNDHNLTQQGFTILEETLISYFIKTIGKDPAMCDVKEREIASQAAKICHDAIPQEQWKEPARSHKKNVEQYLLAFQSEKSLIVVFHDIRNLRNDINHAGLAKDAAKPEKLRTRLSEIINTILNHKGILAR
jgi:CRISPR-associated Csx2 family protein